MNTDEGDGQLQQQLTEMRIFVPPSEDAGEGEETTAVERFNLQIMEKAKFGALSGRTSTDERTDGRRAGAVRQLTTTRARRHDGQEHRHVPGPLLLHAQRPLRACCCRVRARLNI